MIVEKDIPIPLSDGAVVYCNVFRPADGGPHPVLMTHGPYGKDAHFQDAFTPAWDVLKRLYPGLDTDGSSGRYLRWETPDPDRWVPKGYVVIAVDSRGAGKSPGVLDSQSPRETQDYYECIEWAGVQPWSNGKIGLLGISYYGINQWKVAAMRPPHLAAICPWEGCTDPYRDQTYHGGIFSNTFGALWWERQIVPIQNGNAKTHYFDRDTGKPPTGTPLDDATLAANLVNTVSDRALHPFDDEWHAEKRANLSRIQVPVLSAGNWGGMGLHLRGNVEGFMGAGSEEKWLEMHGGTHYESFFLPEFIELQQRFFDCYLKGIDNGWKNEPRVLLNIRHPGDHFELRKESEWPLARTRWTPFYLNTEATSLDQALPAKEAEFAYNGLDWGIELSTPPMRESTEITGPVVANLWVKSESTDMDVFLTLRAFDPDGKEVSFRGATDPAVPVAQGWLRASHRATDPEKSQPWRPFHKHDKAEPLVPGQPYQIAVEIWPTCVVLPKGYRLTLRIDGKDFQREGGVMFRQGSGPFLHTDPKDRKPEIFGARNFILSGGQFDSHLVLPIIPGG